MNDHDIACLLDDIKNLAAEAFTANLIAFYAALDDEQDMGLKGQLRNQILDRLGVYE